jgi:hypothetical protein
MNDLQTVRAALAQDEPAQEVVDRSRHRLRNRMRNGRSAMPRRTMWLAAGATVTAAAAAVAVVVVPSAPPAAPRSAPPPSSSAPAPVSGQQILLAAATAAEQEPADSGTYWHVRIATAEPGDVYEYWTTPNGEWWFRGGKSDGEVVAMPAHDESPFGLVGADLTLAQLRALPTDPEELKTAIATATANGDAMTSAGPLKDVPELFEQAKFDSLISLVSTLPAPPALRAAALRAIATYPGVRNLGEVPGGHGLLLPGDVRLVVDPATGRVNGTSTYVTADGAIATVTAPNTARITAEWTDTLPS